MSEDHKNILIAVPELSYSGSVYSSLRIARVLAKEFHIQIVSYEEGPFRREYEKEGFPVKIIDKNSIYENESIKSWLNQFDLLIANTIIVYALADYAKNIIPTVWYIREAQNLSWQFFKYDYKRYYALKRAETIYAVSEYAADYIRSINPNVQVIHNCVEDISDSYNKTGEDDGIIRFLMLGTLEPRKAFDVVVEAYRQLTLGEQQQIEVHIAGRITEYAKTYAEALLEKINKEPNIIYHGEIQDRSVLMQLMADSDVVIVPSKDESCSLVALEGAMMKKPLILSENIGAKYLVKDDCGWIFETDSVNSLARVFSECISLKDRLPVMGEAIRREYLKTSTFDLYSQNIMQMVKDHLSEDKKRYYEDHVTIAECEKEQRIDEAAMTKPLYLFAELPQKGESIVLYGAGEAGCALADYCSEQEIDYVWTDGDEKKWGEEKKGHSIMSPQKVLKGQVLVYVAVCSSNVADEIRNFVMSHCPSANVIWAKPELIRR